MGIEDERSIRLANPRPQFPYGDFVGLADGLAREVGVLPQCRPIILCTPLWRAGR